MHLTELEMFISNYNIIFVHIFAKMQVLWQVPLYIPLYIPLCIVKIIIIRIIDIIRKNRKESKVREQTVLYIVIDYLRHVYSFKFLVAFYRIRVYGYE